MITRNRAFALGLSLVSAGWAVHASAAPTFTLFDVTGAGTGANQGTLVSDMTRGGVVVGSYIDSANHLHAYLRDDGGVFHFFDVTGQSAANAATPNGGTVGFAIDNAGTHGVLEVGETTMQFDAPGSTDTEAEGVTRLSKIVGIYLDSNNAAHGFLRNRGGGIHPFSAPGAGTGSGQGTFAFAILLDDSTAGYVVDGSSVRHGFLRDGAGAFTVFDPPGAVRTSAICMDDSHNIGGSYRDSASVIHGFVRNGGNGTFTIIDAPGAGAGALQGTNVRQINGRGAMTGSYTDASGISHGYFRNSAGKIKSFDAPGAHMVSGQGTIAQTINAGNQIAGYYFDSAGATHGFIRNP